MIILLFLLACCFCGELLVHLVSASQYLFPVLWYYSLLLWLTKEKAPLYCTGLLAFLCAPLFGVSLSLQFAYIALITLSNFILSPVFISSRIVMTLFACYSLLVFACCVKPISPLWFLANLGIIAFLLLLIELVVRLDKKTSSGILI